MSKLNDTLAYERLNLEALQKAIGLSEGEHLLVRSPFRWMLDGQVVSNAYEMFEMQGVCEERGWQIVETFGEHIAIVRDSNEQRRVDQEAKG